MFICKSKNQSDFCPQKFFCPQKYLRTKKFFADIPPDFVSRFNQRNPHRVLFCSFFVFSLYSHNNFYFTKTEAKSGERTDHIVVFSRLFQLLTAASTKILCWSKNVVNEQERRKSRFFLRCFFFFPFFQFFFLPQNSFVPTTITMH